MPATGSAALAAQIKPVYPKGKAKPAPKKKPKRRK